MRELSHKILKKEKASILIIMVPYIKAFGPTTRRTGKVSLHLPIRELFKGIS